MSEQIPDAAIAEWTRLVRNAPTVNGAQTVLRWALGQAQPVLTRAAVEQHLRQAAFDVHLWAHAMTTQQTATAATFAADRILELAGMTTEQADEVAREAHGEWLARIARAGGTP